MINTKIPAFGAVHRFNLPDSADPKQKGKSIIELHNKKIGPVFVDNPDLSSCTILSGAQLNIRKLEADPENIKI